MNLKSLIVKKRYIKKIYLWILIGILTILLVFSFFVFFSVKNIMFNYTLDSDKKILNQIKFNIDYMNETLVNLCFTTFYNSDAQDLMSNNNLEYSVIDQNVGMLKTSIVNTNPIIKSIYVYNGKQNIYYTTLDKVLTDDPSLDKLIKSYKEAPPCLTPIYRVINSSDNSGEATQYLFTYFIYQTTALNGNMNQAVIINCDAQWLLNNINQLNTVNGKYENDILIMNEDGNFIGNTNKQFNASLKSNYSKYLKTITDKSSGIFKCNILNKDYLVSFTNDNKTNWVLIRVQTYDSIFENINTINNTFILILLIFIVIAILVSLPITGIIYKPINKLVKRIRTNDSAFEEENDEINFIKQVYDNSSRQLDLYKSKENSDDLIYKSYFLRKLILNSSSIKNEELDNVLKKNIIVISFNLPLIICIIKIDNYKKHLEKYNSDDMDLYNYAIINITCEILSSFFKNEAIDFKNNQIVIIVNIGESSNFYVSLKKLIKQAQDSIIRYFGISISVSISNPCNKSELISILYTEAINTLQYKIIYGDMSIITSEMIHENFNNDKTGIESELEERLIQKIKNSNIYDIQIEIDKIFVSISKLKYNNIILALIHLIYTIKISVDELNMRRLEPICFDTSFLSNEILDMESLEQLKNSIMNILEESLSKSGFVENEKQNVIINAVKEIINNNYHDSQLYLPEISKKLNLSPQYVGRVFKAFTGMSITDYISDYRLDKATEWLLNSNLNIHEIIPKIGIENESYFYKIFKQKYGVTPREYIISKNKDK
jgi:AraC-like DNA-binding protein